MMEQSKQKRKSHRPSTGKRAYEEPLATGKSSGWNSRSTDSGVVDSAISPYGLFKVSGVGAILDALSHKSKGECDRQATATK